MALSEFLPGNPPWRLSGALARGAAIIGLCPPVQDAPPGSALLTAARTTRREPQRSPLEHCDTRPECLHRLD